MSDLSTISRLLDAMQADLQADEVSHALRKARHALENAQAELDELARRFPKHVFNRNGRLLVLREAATPTELLAAFDARLHAERALTRLQQGTRLPAIPVTTSHQSSAEDIASLGISRERRHAEAKGEMYLSGD